jgi:hypothetical protein
LFVISFFAPASAARSTGSDFVNFTQIVQKRTPSIQWPAPAGISYGTALGSAQFSATSSTPGSFTYSPPVGTILNAGTHMLTALFTPADTLDLNSATASVSIEVNKAQATVSLDNLQQSFTGQPVPVSAATSPAGLSLIITYNGVAAAPTSPGNYLVVATINDPNYAGSATGTLTIVGAVPAINLSSSTPVMLLGSPVSIVATLTSKTGTPTGQLSFQDGSILLGSVPLVFGQATLTTSALGLGVHSITVIYNGNGNYATATSSPISIEIIDYSLAGPSGAQTIFAGTSAAYSLSIIPTSGNVIPLPSYLSVSGLPAQVTFSVSPAVWVQSQNSTWMLIANTPLPSTTITFHDQSIIVERDGSGGQYRKIPELAFAILLLPFLGRLRRARGRLRVQLNLCLLLASGALTLISLSACSAIYGFNRTPPQTYPITVTVSSGAVQHSTTLYLTVE